MGTINTAEVAKKNPSVYIEMVQQKADLDLAALENSRQLSLLYLETYARENNLTESEKIHLENVIDYKVFTEEAAVKKSLWERIKAAFKRLFDWLFGKGSPKIREEDMNKEVKCKFNVDDVNKQASGIEGLVRKLTGSQTKGDADTNAKELSNTVNKLKEYGSKTGWTIATLAAVDALKKTLGNILSSTTTAMDSFEKSYNAEMEKYNKEDLSNEEKEKRDELKDVNDSVINALKQLHTEITEIDKEVTRLSTLSAEGKLDEANKDGEGKEEKKETNPNAAKMAALSGDGGGNGSAPQSTDVFINWINNYHYRYHANQLSNGVNIVPMVQDKKYKAAYEELEKLGKANPAIITKDDIENNICNKAGVGNKYPIGVLPGVKIPDADTVKGAIVNKLKTLCSDHIAEDIIVPALYGSGSDWYHANKDAWNVIGDKAANAVISEYVVAAAGSNFDRPKWMDSHINPTTSTKNGKTTTTYKNVGHYQLNKHSTEWATKIVNAMNTAQGANFNYGAWGNGKTNGSGGKDIQDAVKEALNLSANDPNPLYYTL